MTPAELASWHEANDLTRRFGHATDRPCRDCPLWFAEEMRAVGRCNGEPSMVGRMTGWRKQGYAPLELAVE